MGFIKAFSGALSGTFADQWKDYYYPSKQNETVAVFPATKQSQNNGIGENTKGQANVITNGSKIVVYEGTALVTLQDGGITGFITEPGGYEFHSDDPNSKSLFAGDGILSSTIGESWERMKFGGMASTTQLAFYINLKEIPGLTFGTQGPIYWNDAFLETQAGAVARGNYSIKLINPLEFFKEIPDTYKVADAQPFDFNDIDNKFCETLFSEFVGCLPGAFGEYTKDPAGHTIMDMQADQTGIAQVLGDNLEKNYGWKTKRGLDLLSVSIISLEYDANTAALLEEIRKDDAEIRKAKRMGATYSENMPGMMAAASAEAMKSAASNENGAMMGFMGMNMATMQANNMMGAAANMQQASQPAPAEPAPVETSAETGTENVAAAATEDPYAKLASLKQLLDQGVISQEDFDAAKNKLLGI